MPPIIIGIAGGTASGKTTIAKKIQGHFKGNVSLISHDNYYRAHEDLPFSEREKLNYDEPAAFETELLIDHLTRLKRGEVIEAPQYDYENHTRKRETVTICPGKVSVLEGILIFSDPALLDLIDIKIYVDTPADIRVLRRIRRDMEERGRTFDSIEAQYLTTVRKMHERYVEATKWLADVVIPNGENPNVLDMLYLKIESLL